MGKSAKTPTTRSRSRRKPASSQRAVSRARPLAALPAAKLSAPRLPDAAPRERLFSWLDRHQRFPLIWIAGPPGSGKTTLVAGYFERPARTVLWYRADAGDADLSTVFYHLREAVRVLRGQAAERLPLLTPEYVFDVPTYARNFVRDMFALLATPTTLVIDNLQEPSEGALDLLLNVLVTEAPHGTQLIAISRNEPPPIAGLQVKGMLARLDWKELRLTLDEAREIAALNGFTDPAFVRHQYTACDGWVAGFNLLLQHTRRLTPATALQSGQTRAALFDYFTGELFDSATPAGQHFVLCTALLPNFTLTQASAFSTPEKAQEVIDWLLKHNFFIDRRAGEEPVYYYHDLYRQFLLDRGRSVFAPDQRRTLLRQAAVSAERRGQPEAALTLLMEAEAWSEALRLLTSIAPAALQQGRNASLDHWIDGFPPAFLSETPWLLYWQGMARLTTEPAVARRSLEIAYARFEEARDLMACLLTCAGIFQSFFLEWGDLKPLDLWLEKFRALVQTPGFDIAAEIDVQVLPSMMALVLRHLDDPLVDSSFERAQHLIRAGVDPTQQGPLLFFVLIYCVSKGLWAEALPHLNQLERVADASAPPLVRLYRTGMRLLYVTACSECASEAEGRRLIRQFIELSESSGIRTLDCFGLGQGIYFALTWRDAGLAQELLERMRHAAQPQRVLDLWHYHWLCAMVALERGELATASTYTKLCVDAAAYSGIQFGRCQGHVLSALVHFAAGRLPPALSEIDRLIELARTLDALPFIYSGLLIKAYLLLRSGDESAGLALLQQGLTLGRSTGQSKIVPVAPSCVTSYLYAIALHQDIEADYVRKLIKVYRIPPPAPEFMRSSDLERWPWPLRIYTLGHFSLLKHDVLIRMARKAQKKPLQLLQALIALGGRSVPIDALVRQVWPRQGAAARATLHVTLTRLRRLLGDPNVLILNSGMLSLNEQVCWLDVWAFERRTTDTNREKSSSASNYSDTLDLYRGPFLAGDDELASVGRLRDRLLAKFQRLALHAGKTLEHAEQWDSAAELYDSALERDVSNEELYRRLMYCDWKRGRRPEALRHYRRCRQLLAHQFQAKPSMETERLYLRIQNE